MSHRQTHPGHDSPIQTSPQFFIRTTYLVEVDRRPPVLLVRVVEVPHTDLTEVTGVVLVDVGAVVVLTTGHTATTRVLTVLANTTVTGGNMTAAVKRGAKQSVLSIRRHSGRETKCEDISIVAFSG